MKPQVWNAFTTPNAIAVVGASDKAGNVGSAVFTNLKESGYSGSVYIVNSKRDSVMGVKAYPDLSALPTPVDLAVIATPAPTVPDIVRQCGAAGIPAAIVLSAGFDEAGDAGRALSDELRRAAIHSGVRVLGPNCVGLIVPHSKVNASFGMCMPQSGSVAFLSQSGALGTAILDWSVREKIGLSAFVSLGATVDIGWAEMLDCLADDPNTKSIIIYMESVDNAREFMSAARELALHKPIIALKAGRHSEGAKAAMSHTGAMAGSDDVVDAAFDRCGVLRVKTIAELFYMAEALSKQPRPSGPRLTVVTNAGGPAVLAADALADEGGTLTELTDQSMACLNKILPPSWSHGNPVDVLGDATAERYAEALRCAIDDPGTDAVLAVLTPQAMTDPTAVAQAVADLPKNPAKPILASWMGGDAVEEGRVILQNASIPSFPYPDTAARIAHLMYRYGESLRNLYETPYAFDGCQTSPGDGNNSHRSQAEDYRRAAEILSTATAAKRILLSEHESKQLLHAYGIPIVETMVANTATEAASMAKAIGFPVVLKLNSDIVTHKNRVGGVCLNLHSEEEVRDAFQQIKESTTTAVSAAAFQGVTVQRMLKLSGCEVIIGSKIDPQFGPVLLFGSGGGFAEAIGDFAVALPPLNTTLANRLMRKTRIFDVLGELAKRSPEILNQLERILVVMSRLVLNHRSISEIEINPLMVSADGLIALDARVTLVPSGSTAVVPTAVAPYPSHLVSPWTTKVGARVMIRPIRPEDEPAMVRFHQRISDFSVYFRYSSITGLDQRIAHERLSRMCFIDYDRQMALVVEYINPGTGRSEIAAVGRLVRQHSSSNAEFALLVSDLWQGQGLGTELYRRLAAHAREMNVDRITAEILPDNEAMLHICSVQGFDLQLNVEARIVNASMDLSHSAEPAANA